MSRLLRSRSWLSVYRRRRIEHGVVRAGRSMVSDGLVVGTVGNVSVRVGETMRITPSARPYTVMSRRDLVTIDLGDGSVSGRHEPSREWRLHAAVYAHRPDVGAIVHCHSPQATAWSFLGQTLEPCTEELTYYGIGTVQTTRQAVGGSAELARHAVETLGASQAVLIYGHGTLAVGQTVEEAEIVARAIEHQATVAWLLVSVAKHYPEARGNLAMTSAGSSISLAKTSSLPARTLRCDANPPSTAVSVR